jgi:hypothetical protein
MATMTREQPDYIEFATVSYRNLYMSKQARNQEFLVEGDDMDQKKNRQASGGRRRPQRGPGAEPMVGVDGAKPP